jgi:hypothetical protein
LEPRVRPAHHDRGKPTPTTRIVSDVLDSDQAGLGVGNGLVPREATMRLSGGEWLTDSYANGDNLR